MHCVKTCNVNAKSGIKDKILSNMSMCSYATDLSHQKKASFFLCLWALIGGIIALILNDANACVELRRMVMATGIGLSVFSFLYVCNLFCWEKVFPVLLLLTFFFVALMDVIFIYIIYESGNPNALVSNDCSDDDRTLPFFIISWISPFVLICIGLSICICRNSNEFYDPNSKDLKGEFRILL